MRSLLLALTLLLTPTLAPAEWPPVYGADDWASFSNLTLRGVDTVAVRVRGVDATLQRVGVDASRLRAQVERRLGEASIRVVSEEEAVQRPGAALLELDVHASRADYGYYSYALLLKLKQKIPLPNDPAAFVSGVVWSDKVGGTMLESDLLRLDRETETLLGRFLEAHGAQNAR